MDDEQPAGAEPAEPMPMTEEAYREAKRKLRRRLRQLSRQWEAAQRPPSAPTISNAGALAL